MQQPLYLAPADLRKEGPAYDLPIALGLLAASEQLFGDVSKAMFISLASTDPGNFPVLRIFLQNPLYKDKVFWYTVLAIATPILYLMVLFLDLPRFAVE